MNNAARIELRTPDASRVRVNPTSPRLVALRDSAALRVMRPRVTNDLIPDADDARDIRDARAHDRNMPAARPSIAARRARAYDRVTNR